MVAKREPSLTTLSNTTLYNNLKPTITTAIFSSNREFFISTHTILTLYHLWTRVPGKFVDANDSHLTPNKWTRL